MRNNNKRWHRHYGVYGVCVNKRKELLVIEKRRTIFWTVGSSWWIL